MSKSTKTAFIIFNVILLGFNYICVPFVPFFLIFGWLPSQLAVFVGSMLIASLGWGLYYAKFYNTQGHVDERYKDEPKG